MDRSFPFSRVVITGGCGYVGRQLANALRAAHPSIEIVLFDLNGKLESKHWSSSVGVWIFISIIALSS